MSPLSPLPSLPPELAVCLDDLRHQYYGRQISQEEAALAACAAAETARGISTPNPAVGAVVCNAAGQVCGIGATQEPGGPHAEVVALEEAGDGARGGSIVVTLEPCSCWGRTAPCTQALINANIATVTYVESDPTEAGGGAAVLREHGVACTQLDLPQARQGALGAWLTAVTTGYPRVTAKMALSLDGYSAAADGTSQWITSAPARNDSHRERACVDAIIVGTGTLVADNPALSARQPDGSLYPHQPERIVMGERSLPGERVTDTAGVYVLPDSYACAPAYHIATRDWQQVMDYCAARGYNDVLVEGGPRLVGAVVASGYADRVIAYIAPTFLTGGLSAASSPIIATLSQAVTMAITSVDRVGSDVRIIVGRTS